MTADFKQMYTYDWILGPEEDALSSLQSMVGPKRCGALSLLQTMYINAYKRHSMTLINVS